MLNRIIEGLAELFPEVVGMNISPETKLGEIPDWDSMSAVNFQGFIEQNFQVAIPQDLLGEETTIEEVMSFITDPETMKEVA